MKVYEIKDGKKVEVKTKQIVKKRPIETESQKRKRLHNEIKGMFNNLGTRI